MPIRYHCPHCRQFLSIATRKAGQASTCPMCGHEHRVPTESEPEHHAPPRSITDAPAPPAATEPPVRHVAAAPPQAHVPHAPTHAASPPPPRVAAHAPPPEPPVDLVPSPLVHGALDPAVPSASPLLAGTVLEDRARHWDDDDEDEEGLTIHGFERKSDELDLIPMVDCVFLLLVFYMITASYALQKMIDMAAPAADKKGTVQAVQSADDTGESSLVVQIDAQNRVTIEDTPVPNLADIPDMLRTKMNGDSKTALVIHADPHAFHETVVAVTDAAKDLPFQHVRMAVRSPDED